jgi:hypothetical protein
LFRIAEIPDFIELQPTAGNTTNHPVVELLAGFPNLAEQPQHRPFGSATDTAGGVDGIAFNKASNDLRPLGSV